MSAAKAKPIEHPKAKKLAGVYASLEKMRGDDMLTRIVSRALDLIQPPYYLPDTNPVEYVLPEDTIPLSEEVLRLREIDSMLSSLSEAVTEYRKKVAEGALHEAMSTKGPTGFKHMGQTFAMSSTNRVKADPSQGGTGNPELKQWLKDNGMPDVAEGTINATTLKSNVNEWIRNNPITKTKLLGDVPIPIEGEELIEELGLVDRIEQHVDLETGEVTQITVTAQEQFDARKAEHERLMSMVDVTTEPSMSITKA